MALVWALSIFVMIHKLRVLKVLFQGEIQPWEVTALRGAIAQKAGFEHILFHNHVDEGFRYRYPLIQYKRIHKKPALLCLGEGIDEIHHFFDQEDWHIRLGERDMELRIDHLEVNQFTMQVWEELFRFRIQNWIALNQGSMKEFQHLQQPEEQIHYLERKLTGNLLSMAKGIDWHVDKQIQVEIHPRIQSRLIKVKGVHLQCFNLEFRTNMFIPNDLGLGKSASKGFGRVWRVGSPQASLQN